MPCKLTHQMQEIDNSCLRSIKKNHTILSQEKTGKHEWSKIAACAAKEGSEKNQMISRLITTSVDIMINLIFL